METTTKIKAMIKSLVEKIEEPEVIKAITQIDSAIDGVDKEYDELLKQHKDLKLDYSNFIKQQGFKGEPNEEITPQKAPSFEEIAEEFVNDKGEEF